MKHKFTLLYFLLFSFAAGAQDITGIWKGYFIQNSYGFSEDRYKYEVQIEQLTNDALNSVTYSYKTTVFYGKAEAKGIHTRKTNNILLNETKMVDLKIADQSQPCLMTLYLEYTKVGDMETLTGTYSSRNLKGSDCGSGKVYLEKSPTTDFYKEEFLINREKELKKKENSIGKNKAPLKGKTGIKPGAEDNLISKRTNTNQATAKVTTAKKPVVKPKPQGVTSTKPTIKNKFVKPEPKSSNKPTLPPATVTIPKNNEESSRMPDPPPPIKVVPKPEILKKRNLDLVKTIVIHSKEFKIDLYDNGEIDGDRISVYHNNELIVSNKTLTDKPISFTIKADEAASVHDFVMVAENLGSIPPNTSLMILTAGGKRYELFVTSTEQKNALVRVEYKPE